MTVLLYTREFWDRALFLVDCPQICEQCKRQHIIRKVDSVVVRVTLVGDGQPIPHRLRLLCTSCYPNTIIKTFTRKQIIANIGDLFDHKPDKARTVNGR